MASMSPPLTGKTPQGTAYRDCGDPDGLPVVLIHGLGLSQAMWDRHLAALSPFRVITYDLFGHGDSAPVPRAADLTLYAGQIVDLCDHLSIPRAALVGFSIGGMINRRFAMDHPDRVAGLAILSSPHDRGAEAQEQVEVRAAAVRDQGAFATFDQALKRWFTPAYLESGDAPDLVRIWRGQADAESYAQAAWVLAHGVRELIRPDPPINVPTLVMTCENDSGSTPAMARDIAAEIAGADLEIVPGLQHLGLMEAPAAVTDPLRAWLSGL